MYQRLLSSLRLSTRAATLFGTTCAIAATVQPSSLPNLPEIDATNLITTSNVNQPNQQQSASHTTASTTTSYLSHTNPNNTNNNASTANSSPVRFGRPRSKKYLNKRPSASRFEDQVVVITGGARGIGQACATRFAQEGAFVYIFDLLDGTETLELINNNESFEVRNNAKYIKLDVTQPEQVNKCVNSVINEHGYIDVVVQCAGITGVTGKQAHLIDTSDFERVWRINMFGIFNVCKAVLPFMLNENYGRIVNVASISGKEGNPGQIAYAASKGAVIAATKTLGKDYAKTGITINSIAPAVIQTKMVDLMPVKQQNMMKSKIPMNRTGELDEISSVIAFIASEENSFTTGFCYDLTGGRATY